MHDGPRSVSPYRCEACGNKTRFDVYEARRIRSFHHQTLGGELTVEEEEILDATILKVTCRWCGALVTAAGGEGAPAMGGSSAL
jgi:transposase